MLKQFTGHYSQKRHILKVLGDLWDREVKRMSEIELRYKPENCVVSKYIGYSSILLRAKAIDQMYELKLNQHIARKIEKWKQALTDDANEKKQLRIRALITEFQGIAENISPGMVETARLTS